MASLVLIRHGQSLWNAENRFTGWRDIGLSDRGREEARLAAALLMRHGFRCDRAFTSALSRARESCAIILREMGSAAEMREDAALNERDYGDLTGMEKGEAARRFGAARIVSWRRGFSEAPPGGESLADTAARVLPFYRGFVAPCLAAGEDILVVAHGNSLRALIMDLEGLSAEEIVGREIGTGEALLYGGDGGAAEILK